MLNNKIVYLYSLQENIKSLLLATKIAIEQTNISDNDKDNIINQLMSYKIMIDNIYNQTINLL